MKINKNIIGNLGFLAIAILFSSTILIVGCCGKEASESEAPVVKVTTIPNVAENDAQYLGMQVQIVDKGGYAERNSKYISVGKFFLVRAVNDTTLFTELNANNFSPDCNCHHGTRYEWDSMYYNHNVGDILTFDYVRKDRFWHNYTYKSTIAKPIIVIVHDSVPQPVYVKYYDADGNYDGKMLADRIVVNYKKQTIFIGYGDQVALYARLRERGTATMEKQP